MSITKYYTKFKSFFDELYELQPIPECNHGASKSLTKRDDEQHVHLFLGCLDNDQFAQIKDIILNSDPLTPLRHIFNHIQ